MIIIYLYGYNDIFELIVNILIFIKLHGYKSCNFL